MLVGTTAISIAFTLVALLKTNYNIELNQDRIRYFRFLKEGNEMFYADIKKIELILNHGINIRDANSILKLSGNYTFECNILTFKRRQQENLLRELIQRAPNASVNRLAFDVSKGDFTGYNLTVDKRALIIALPIILVAILKIVF
jgi:hypothetical protein